MGRICNPAWTVCKTVPRLSYFLPLAQDAKGDLRLALCGRDNLRRSAPCADQRGETRAEWSRPSSSRLASRVFLPGPFDHIAVERPGLKYDPVLQPGSVSPAACGFPVDHCGAEVRHPDQVPRRRMAEALGWSKTMIAPSFPPAAAAKRHPAGLFHGTLPGPDVQLPCRSAGASRSDNPHSRRSSRLWVRPRSACGPAPRRVSPAVNTLTQSM